MTQSTQERDRFVEGAKMKITIEVTDGVTIDAIAAGCAYMADHMMQTLTEEGAINMAIDGGQRVISVGEGRVIAERLSNELMGIARNLAKMSEDLD